LTWNCGESSLRPLDETAAIQGRLKTFASELAVCGLILDAGVLIGLVMALNQDSESPPFMTAVAAAFAISILTVGAYFVLVPLLGLWGIVLIILAAGAIAGAVLWLVFDVPPLRAAIGGAAFLAYKVVFAVAFAFLTSSSA
jgi:hypothetical protein